MISTTTGRTGRPTARRGNLHFRPRPSGEDGRRARESRRPAADMRPEVEWSRRLARWR